MNVWTDCKSLHWCLSSKTCRKNYFEFRMRIWLIKHYEVSCNFAYFTPKKKNQFKLKRCRSKWQFIRFQIGLSYYQIWIWFEYGTQFDIIGILLNFNGLNVWNTFNKMYKNKWVNVLYFPTFKMLLTENVWINYSNWLKIRPILKTTYKPHRKLLQCKRQNNKIWRTSWNVKRWNLCTFPCFWYFFRNTHSMDKSSHVWVCYRNECAYVSRYSKHWRKIDRLCTGILIWKL